MKTSALLISSILWVFPVALTGCSADGAGGTGLATAGSTSTTSAATTTVTTGASATSTTGGPTTTTDEPTSSESTDPTLDTATTATTATTENPGTASESSSESTGSTSEAGSESSSSSESSTGNAELIADLDMTLVIDDTEASIYEQTLTFSEQSCAYVDGCLAGTGQRRLLRFATITPNVGTAAFHAGNPTDNPELFSFSQCQGTYLFTDYAQYRLLDAKGNVAATGHKAAFALIDLVPFLPDAGPPFYGFNGDMGISVGWSDVYSAGLSCQWVDITDVPPGDYMLELHVNPLEVIPEATFDNNVIQIAVTID